MSSISSTLPVELWHQILRSIYEVSFSPSPSSLDSDNSVLLRDYPWVDNDRTLECRASASARHRAVVRSISQVCRSWKAFANQLRYQEIALGPSEFSDLLKEHQLPSSIFHETRLLSVTITWLNNTRDLSLLVQSMPRLEWLLVSTHIPLLPSILGPHLSSLLYLDLFPLHFMDTIFIDSECISLISSIAIRLRRLTCAIKYVAVAVAAAADGGGGGGQMQMQMQMQMRQAAPRFEDLQVLRLIDIRCDPGYEQVTREWFSRWHLPSLKQFYIPRNWEYCTQLLDRGVGAQIEVLDASVCGVFSLFDWFAGMDDIIRNHRHALLYRSDYGCSALARIQL